VRSSHNHRLWARSIASTSTSSSSSIAEDDNNIENDVMISRTRAWVSGWVVENSLCPWAASTTVGNKMRICVKDNYRDDETLRDAVIAECKSLYINHKTGATPVETVLIVLPQLIEYEMYLLFAEVVETELERQKAHKYVQVATFHPDYMFADTDESSVENYTNRSPFPILHLLLVKKVTEAIDAFEESQSHNNNDSATTTATTTPPTEAAAPATDIIWQRNIKRMQELGLERVQDMHRKF
jgi:hypothetical protein